MQHCPTLCSIFDSQFAIKRVKKTHKGCRDYVGDYAEACGEAPNLFNVLIQCSPGATSPKKYKEIKDLWIKSIASEIMPHFSRLGVYNMPSISQKEAVFKFLVSIKDEPIYDCLFEEQPDIDDLIEISKLMSSPTSRLFLKYFYLWLNGEDKKAYPTKSFVGEPAMTAPVQQTCQWLWGHRFTGAEAKELHEGLAKDTGRSELWVNTVLWSLGYYD